MRFLSLLLLPGCALIDAAGDADPLIGQEFTASSIGGFSTPPVRAEVANLDGQFGKDIVALSDSEMLVGIHEGTTYNFMPPTNMPALLGPYTAIAVGNVDGVAPDDMIATGIDRLNVFGTGAKSLPSHVPAGATPKLVTTSAFPTFGGAGGTVIIAYVDSPTVQLVTNPLTPTPTDRVITAGSPPVAVVLADVVVNGVGQDEVLIVESSAVLEAKADTDQFTSVGRSFAGIEITHVAVGDFGSDATVDLAYAYSDGVAIANGSPSGLVAGVSPPRLGQGLAIQELRAGDFDRDGRKDLAILTAADPRELHLFLRGSGESFRETVIPIEGLPETFSVGDLDDDGVDDFLLTPGKEGGIDLLLSR